MQGPAALACMRARTLAPPRKARLVNAQLSAKSFPAPCHLSVVNLRGGSNYTEFGKGFLNPSTYLACGVGGKDVTHQFQPQKSETQAASRNPRAARIAGADPGGSSDAGPDPFARGYPQEADRACFSGICRSRAAQRRHPARSLLLGRDDVEIGVLYPRLGWRRAQLRHIARQPAA